MLLSGFAGISYEILYGRILGNLIGDQFAVSASILITFLLGIGVGAVCSHRLWRHLWLIEALIGLCGLFFAFGTDVLDGFFYAQSQVVPAGLEGTLLICVILLIVPAFLIGCSLPLFAGYLGRLTSGLVFARAYAVYNFGAGLTALLIEFLLIRELGIRGSVILIAAINGLVALLLRTTFAHLRCHGPEASEAPIRFPAQQLAALVLVSIGSAVFQLFMVRLAELLLGPFRETFALVLSIILFGIAAGSTLVKVLRLRFATLLWLNLAGLLVIFGGLESAVSIYAALYQGTAQGPWSAAALKWLTLALLMALPAITFGATIPALLTRQQEVARESGQLLFVSALANATGFLLMSFVLHRHLDYGVQLLVVAAFCAGALVLTLGRRWRPIIGLAAVLLVMVGVHRQCWDEDLLYLSYTSFRSTETLARVKAETTLPDRFKGNQDVFSINWNDGAPYFFINGYISIPLNSPSEKMVGAVSAIFAPRTDQALVLGLGSGATASTVGRLFQHTDVVEINPVVRENLDRMERWHYDIENNPKVKIFVDDGIHFTKLVDKKYSLILNTVTTPLYFSSSKLYTEDFFKVIRQRLTPDGVYVTWLDGRVGDRGTDIILKTLAQGFRNCAILYIDSSYFMLIASQKPLWARHLELPENDHVIRNDLLMAHGTDAQLLPYHLLNTRALDLLGDSSVPINTADRPSLEFEMARLREDGFPLFARRLFDSIDLGQLARALQSVKAYDPVKFAFEASFLYEDSWLRQGLFFLVQQDIPDFEERLSQIHMAYLARQEGLAAESLQHHEAGLALFESSRYAEALEEFLKAQALSPGHENAYFSIGLCHEAMGQVRMAERFYKMELQGDPANQEARQRLERLNSISSRLTR